MSHKVVRNMKDSQLSERSTLLRLLFSLWKGGKDIEIYRFSHSFVYCPERIVSVLSWHWILSSENKFPFSLAVFTLYHRIGLEWWYAECSIFFSKSWYTPASHSIWKYFGKQPQIENTWCLDLQREIQNNETNNWILFMVSIDNTLLHF